MAESDTSNESIRIYKVLDPSALLEARDRLAVIFAGRPEDDDIVFDVSNDGGRIWFSDKTGIWRSTDQADLPSNSYEAEIAGRAFIGRTNSSVQGDRALAEAGISGLFPEDIRPSRIAVVTDPDRGVADHWIVSFDAYLPTGTDSGAVLVYGANIDVRVGPGNRIVGCGNTWRPCFPQGVTDLVPKPPVGSSDNDSSKDVQLEYLLSDEGVEQRFIAPYYFVPVEDDGYFLPASLFSPVAKIVDDETSNSPRLKAEVFGGSGNFAFRWAAFSLTDPQEGVTDFGSDLSIGLTPGCYNVILRVMDTLTDVVVYTERQVFTGMFLPVEGNV